MGSRSPLLLLLLLTPLLAESEAAAAACNREQPVQLSVENSTFESVLTAQQLSAASGTFDLEFSRTNNSVSLKLDKANVTASDKSGEKRTAHTLVLSPVVHAISNVKQPQLEAQLLFNSNSNSKAPQAIVWLYVIGQSQPKLPNVTGANATVKVDVGALLPKSLTRFFAFEDACGSWAVAAEPLTASADELKAFGLDLGVVKDAKTRTTPPSVRRSFNLTEESPGTQKQKQVIPNSAAGVVSNLMLPLLLSLMLLLVSAAAADQ